MIWITLALIGALCTALTAIFAKKGIKDVNSNFATFYRTGIVIVFALIICLITQSITTISELTFNNYLFLILSGIATGCSWLCYYKALKIGDVNKVTPIDKSSYILSSLLFLIFFFDDTTKGGDVLTIIMIFASIVLISIGTMFMINKRDPQNPSSNKYLIYAIFSAIFAALVSLFVKIGLKDIQSDLGTLIRTIVVFIFAGTIVFTFKDYRGSKSISKGSWLFLTLSGIATGGAWLCEYAALNYAGANPIAVNSISKLSILLTMLFSALIMKEKFTKKTLLGLAIMTIGIVIIIIFSL